ncbi:inositol-3-phosphate synthase 1-B isoform X2 [Ischnura elegans]|uniref:inositol-3-phosphate synthase 1-B isoform X2 n=1 Tax=Ischnura elegans TaxID=197161 RepID=UPI001ED8A5C5|nr:inositol-3-phosphate synthase 1-B isoform X2 [Ischnura elegans]
MKYETIVRTCLGHRIAMQKEMVYVDTPYVTYNDDYIDSKYVYQMTKVSKLRGKLVARPEDVELKFHLRRHPGRVGVMLVGWGGNNGSTLTAALEANKLNLHWEGPQGGIKKPDWFGSLTQASTIYLGLGEDGNEVHVPWSYLVPLLDVNTLVVDGWDISGLDLASAVARAHVLDIDLQKQVTPVLKLMKPRASIFDPKFVAANQEDRADNVINGTKSEQVKKVRADMAEFRRLHNLDTVIIVWTANTERYCEVIPGVHDTADGILSAVRANHAELSPSTLFAIAAIQEGCPFINGSPQNTLVPGVLDLAERNGVFVAGDDFKSGQTKLKSVLVDFLVGAGIKPMSIVSYNHLGNNDGKNLSSPQQFKSKEISKSNVVDDMVASNPILYAAGEKPDHCVVIKYIPYVGDSKRAMDEYTSEIMMGGRNTIAIHNTCEDSLLAAPLILDLVVLTEFFGRLKIGTNLLEPPLPLQCALSLLGYFLKAPVGPPGTPVVNALAKQRACLENLIRACVGLCPVSHMHLEHRVSSTAWWTRMPHSKS